MNGQMDVPGGGRIAQLTDRKERRSRCTRLPRKQPEVVCDPLPEM
jgi:hypothetical protein